MCACAYGDPKLMSCVFFGQPPPQLRQGHSLSLDLTVLTILASQFTLGIPSLLLPKARTTGVWGGHDPMTFNIKKIKRFVLMFTCMYVPYVHRCHPPRPEEGIGTLEAEGTGSWNYLMWVLGTVLKSL